MFLLKKRECSRRECDSIAATLVGAETVQNLIKDGNIGGGPNVDRKKKRVGEGMLMIDEMIGFI